MFLKKYRNVRNLSAPSLLLATGMLSTGLTCAPAHAAEHKKKSVARDHAQPRAGASTMAAPATPVRKQISGSTPEEVQVRAHKQATGGGLMRVQTEPRSRSEVTQEFISKQAPTIAPTSLIASLPGVQAGSESPLGTEFETVHIRGLDQTQIGFLFEGVPVSDVFSYVPWTTSMVDNENLSSVSVTQGSVDLSAPLYNADGAQVTMKEMRPTDKFSGFADFSGGTHSLQKQFIRLNTGEIGHSDVRAFASFSHSAGNLWRGSGTVERFHVDANLEKRWTKDSVSDVIFGFNQGHQNIYRYPTLAQWQQYGTGFNYPATYTPGDTNYYKINERFTNVIFGTIHNDFKLAKGLTLHVQPYATSQKGPNNYGMTVPTAGGYLGTQRYDYLDGYEGQNNTLTVESVHPWEQRTSGVTVSLDWKTRHNTLSLFYWYSFSDHQESQDNYLLSSTGDWSYSQRPLTVDGRKVTTYDVNSVQQMNAIGFDDKLSLLSDRLLIDAGFKVSMASRMNTQNLPGADPYKSSPNYFVPTPQLLVSYKITPNDQVHFNATTSYRLPAGWSAYLPNYSVTSPNPVGLPPDSLAPEYLIGQEVGYRHSSFVNVSIAGFHYNLTNHQISSSSYLPGSATLISTQIAAGGEEAWGVQAEVATRPWHHISAYLSGQYLRTRIGNNVNAGSDYLPTKGKSEPGAPKFSGAIGLTYDDGTWFGNFNLRYQDSQYSTLMNDQSIPAYFTGDLSLGRNLPSFGRFHPKGMLNLINVGGVNYLSSISGFGITAVKQKGIFGNVVNASAPSYVVGSAFTAMFTLSADF